MSTHQPRIRWEPESGEITLGDIAKVLQELADMGTTRGSILYCVDKVDWPEGRD